MSIANPALKTSPAPRRGSRVDIADWRPEDSEFWETTGKKIATLRDLRGLRVRVSSPTMGLALAKLGAIPLGIPAATIGDATHRDAVVVPLGRVAAQRVLPQRAGG